MRVPALPTGGGEGVGGGGRVHVEAACHRPSTGRTGHPMMSTVVVRVCVCVGVCVQCSK